MIAMCRYRPTWRVMIGFSTLLVLLALPLKAADLVFGTGNDWATMGFGNNEDDGHSFSAYGAARFDNDLLLSLDIDGYTDQQTTHKRYSTLSLSLTYPFRFHPRSYLSLSLSPTLGVHLAGNLGMEKVQNLFHHILGLEEVVLPEAYPELKVMALMRVSAHATVSLGSSRFGVDVTASSVPLWESTFDLSLYYQVWELLTVGGGYHLPIAHDTHPVRDLDLGQRSGFYLFTAYQTPLFDASWTISPRSGFSWGSFSFHVLALGQPKRFKKADLSTVSGMYHDIDGYQSRNSAALLYKGFLLQVHYSNGAIDKEKIYRRNTGTWTVGWQWEPVRDSAPLRPSLSFLAGVKRYNLNKNVSEVIIDEVRPVIGIEAGLGLGAKDRWVTGNSAYHFRLGVALHYTIAASTLATSYPEWDRIARPLTLLFGLVLQIDHDLDTGTR